MIIYPAIDLLGGKVVRLEQGDYNKVTVYSEDPLKVAEDMVAAGASWIHIVDLDGAREGAPKNLKTVYRISTELHPHIQFGGGLRSALQIEQAFEAGVSRAVLSTRALTDPEFLREICDYYYEDVIAVSIDAVNDKVKISGWKDESGISTSEAVEIAENAGVSYIIFTDIEKDGTGRGVNVERVNNLLSLTSLPVIFAGGISSISDLEQLSALENKGLHGAIIGKAYYENKIDLKEAIEKFQPKEIGEKK